MIPDKSILAEETFRKEDVERVVTTHDGDFKGFTADLEGPGVGEILSFIMDPGRLNEVFRTGGARWTASHHGRVSSFSFLWTTALKKSTAVIWEAPALRMLPLAAEVAQRSLPTTLYSNFTTPYAAIRADMSIPANMLGPPDDRQAVVRLAEPPPQEQAALPRWLCPGKQQRCYGLLEIADWEGTLAER